MASISTTRATAQPTAPVSARPRPSSEGAAQLRAAVIEHGRGDARAPGRARARRARGDAPARSSERAAHGRPRPSPGPSSSGSGSERFPRSGTSAKPRAMGTSGDRFPGSRTRRPEDALDRAREPHGPGNGPPSMLDALDHASEPRPATRPSSTATARRARRGDALDLDHPGHGRPAIVEHAMPAVMPARAAPGSAHGHVAQLDRGASIERTARERAAQLEASEPHGRGDARCPARCPPSSTSEHPGHVEPPGRARARQRSAGPPSSARAHGRGHGPPSPRPATVRAAQRRAAQDTRGRAPAPVMPSTAPGAHTAAPATRPSSEPRAIVEPRSSASSVESSASSTGRAANVAQRCPRPAPGAQLRAPGQRRALRGRGPTRAGSCVCVVRRYDGTGDRARGTGSGHRRAARARPR
jgi:hypothetical protein